MGTGQKAKYMKWFLCWKDFLEIHTSSEIRCEMRACLVVLHRRGLLGRGGRFVVFSCGLFIKIDQQVSLFAMERSGIANNVRVYLMFTSIPLKILFMKKRPIL